MTMLCGGPALFALIWIVVGWRNRLFEVLEIGEEGVALKNSWRLKTFYEWREVDVHRDPKGKFSAEATPLTPNGIGLLDPLYPMYLREHGWANPEEIAIAVFDAQLTHYLPQLIADIEDGTILWFGDYALSEQGVHWRPPDASEAEVLYWHVINRLQAQLPVLDWKTVKFGNATNRRSKRVQSPYRIDLIVSYENAPFGRIEIYHQTLLFLHLLEAIGHPVTLH